MTVAYADNRFSTIVLCFMGMGSCELGENPWELPNHLF